MSYASSSAGDISVLTRQLSQLPSGLCAEVSLCLCLRELAALVAVEYGAWQKLWDAPELWHGLAVSRGLSIKPSTIGCEARRDFRCALFHLDGNRLRSLEPSACQAILEEAARMMSGLMHGDMEDPSVAVEALCARAELALVDHDPSNGAAAAAAEAFLLAARRHFLVIGEARMERFEHISYVAQDLDAMRWSARAHSLEDAARELEESFWDEGPFLRSCCDSEGDSESQCSPD